MSSLYVWAFSPLDKPDAKLGSLVAEDMEDARQRLFELITKMKVHTFRIVEDNDDHSRGRLTLPTKSGEEIVWALGNALDEVNLYGEEPGIEATAYMVFAEGRDTVRGPCIARGRTIVAALSAFLYDDGLSLADGKDIVELDRSATRLRESLSSTSWNIGNMREDDVDSYVVIEKLPLAVVPQQLEPKMWLQR